MEWNQLVRDQWCQEDFVQLEQNEQHTNTVKISVVNNQSTEIKKSVQLELPFQHTSQHRETITLTTLIHTPYYMQ